MSLMKVQGSHTVGNINIYISFKLTKSSHSQYIKNTHKSIRKGDNPI